MNQSMRNFDERLRRIERARGGKGRATRYLIDDRGRVRRRGARRYSLWRLIRALALLALALLVLKIVAFAALGEAEYGHRAEELAAGSGLEQLIARGLAPDPLTLALAPYLRPLLKDL
ncbi:hypothetical protein SAMN06297129_1974 [Pseudooceanicola antarcticus]|uniref:Uncharacterized protein n=2 Tax=Pseudooceanicola antarcticus TaxID=1247613 RepID=A0A285IUX0_9RHOB|nr:hypothetical protein [Pseudooceanicola antarcticus]SNY50896.1 hypothetical protein SAMN06297129_1974 [Pseudooceanicola antarcticus]